MTRRSTQRATPLCAVRIAQEAEWDPLLRSGRQGGVKLLERDAGNLALEVNDAEKVDNSEERSAPKMAW